MNSDKIRVAVINQEKCKPNKCNLECRSICPIENMGTECINVTKKSKSAHIVEDNCNGCNMCVKKCPFNAISIIQLPKSTSKNKTHRYTNNGFILHKLPIPKIGQVIGLIGANGTGKSTVLKIISGLMVPNSGIINDEIQLSKNTNDIEDIYDNNHNKPTTQIAKWSDFNKYGKKKDKEKNIFIKKLTNKTELQEFFKKLSNNNINAILKVQHIDNMINNINIANQYVCEFIVNNEIFTDVLAELEIMYLHDKTSRRMIKDLSGGELQRLCIAHTVSQVDNYDMIIFDEPTSYLDIRQRMIIAKVIKKIASRGKYVFVVDHDLSIIDYMTDYVHILFGKPSVFGIVSDIHNTREGLNAYMSGFIQSENMRFRDESIDFKLRNPYDSINKDSHIFTQSYPQMTKTFGNLKINVSADYYTDSEITVLCGGNGAGKTTFLKLLAGIEKPDDDNIKITNDVTISFKKQRLCFDKNNCSVEEYLISKISGALYYNTEFIHEVLKPLKINDIANNNINKLSGGEMQRVCLALCLGDTSAQIYLIDEPSAFLDVEQRISVSKMLRKYMYFHKKTAFIVEHDIMMCSYLADKMIVFDQSTKYNDHTQSMDYFSNVNKSEPAESGMDKFLHQMNISLRYDVDSGRPRINKPGSNKDKISKKN